MLLWIESRWTTKNWFDLLNLDLSLYDLQVGEPLLTPSLGFPSMESLLRSLPDVCTLRHSGGQLVVMGVASSATAHVQDMVAKQNTARRGKKRGGGVGGAICRGRSERGAAGQYSAGRGGRGFKTFNACRGFSGAFNGDGGEAYGGLSGGRGGREFGRGSWSGKPLYPKSLAPNRYACRDEPGFPVTRFGSQII